MGNGNWYCEGWVLKGVSQNNGLDGLVDGPVLAATFDGTPAVWCAPPSELGWVHQVAFQCLARQDGR